MEGALEVLAETARWLLVSCSVTSTVPGPSIPAVAVDCRPAQGQGSAHPMQRDYFVGSITAPTGEKSALFVFTDLGHIPSDMRCMLRQRRMLCGSVSTLITALTTPPPPSR